MKILEIVSIVKAYAIFFIYTWSCVNTSTFSMKMLEAVTFILKADIKNCFLFIHTRSSALREMQHAKFLPSKVLPEITSQT